MLKFFSLQRRLIKQEQELAKLRHEVNTLSKQNESMKQGMRRCISCNYRIDSKQKSNTPST